MLVILDKGSVIFKKKLSVEITSMFTVYTKLGLRNYLVNVIYQVFVVQQNFHFSMQMKNMFVDFN